MRTAVALLVGAFVAVVAGIALVFLLGGLTSLAAIVSLVIGAAVTGLAWRQTSAPESPVRPIHPVEWLLIGVFACVSLRAFLWLLYIKDQSWHVISPNNLGDLPLHMDFIRYLASGVRFWPESPIFMGEPLKYPIGGDFFNSLLLAAGLPIERGLVWVGLAGCTLTAVALWRWGRGFALAAFLFGGGLSAFALLAHPELLGQTRLIDYQATQTWKNLFLSLLVTQRGLLFALPAGLFLLDHWRSRYLRGERGLLPGWAALLLYATMPLFNVHAFLYLSIALAGMWIFAKDKAARLQGLRFVAMAFLPAAFCAALVTGGFSAGGGVHWQVGWMQSDEKGVSPWWFWLRNFGLYLVLWAGLVVIAILRGPRETRAIVLPATVMFLACAFVSFAPWPWDNTKLLLWSWLAVAPCIWSDLLLPLHKVPRAALCLVLFFTGAVSLAAGLDSRHGYGLMDVNRLQDTAEAVRDIPPEARFGSAPDYAHPLIVLGRKVGMGYPGHLTSHGITYQGRNQDKVTAYENLMRGGPGWQENARTLGIDYIYWSPAEERYYPGSLKPWKETLPAVARGADFEIYKLPSR